MAEQDDRRLLDFRVLAGWVATAALALGALAFVGVVVDGLARGLTFRLMGRWLTIYMGALLIASGLLAAVHAVRGFQQARRRGEPIADDDVGFLPKRPPGDESEE